MKKHWLSFGALILMLVFFIFGIIFFALFLKNVAFGQEINFDASYATPIDTTGVFSETMPAPTFDDPINFATYDDVTRGNVTPRNNTIIYDPVECKKLGVYKTEGGTSTPQILRFYDVEAYPQPCDTVTRL